MTKLTELQENLNLIQTKIKEFDEIYKSIVKAIEEENKVVVETKPKINHKEMFHKRVEEEDNFFYLDEYFEISEIEDNYDYSDGTESFESFNYFDKKEDAEFLAKYFKTVAKIYKAKKYVNGDWTPEYNYSSKHIINFSIKYNGQYVYHCDNYSNESLLLFKSEQARDIFREIVTDEEIRLFLNPMGVQENAI